MLTPILEDKARHLRLAFKLPHVPRPRLLSHLHAEPGLGKWWVVFQEKIIFFHSRGPLHRLFLLLGVSFQLF